MKRIIIKLIKLYQHTPTSWHGHCRFQPTCSSYAIEALEKRGFWVGSYLAINRILRCHPWGKMGYDPVPERNKKK